MSPNPLFVVPVVLLSFGFLACFIGMMVCTFAEDRELNGYLSNWVSGFFLTVLVSLFYVAGIFSGLVH